MKGGQIDHFYSGLEQDSAPACMVPSGELEHDTSWGKRILPPEQIQPLNAEPVQNPCQGAWQQDHGLARSPLSRAETALLYVVVLPVKCVYLGTNRNKLKHASPSLASH